jgi:hypothetical protein
VIGLWRELIGIAGWQLAKFERGSRAYPAARPCPGKNCNLLGFHAARSFRIVQN